MSVVSTAPDKDESELLAALQASTITSNTTQQQQPQQHQIPDAQISGDELAVRNKKLIDNMRSVLKGDEKAFKSFKQLSSQFRQGKIGAQEYYDRFARVFGDKSNELFVELVALLPDRQKQLQLKAVYEQALSRERDFPTLRPTQTQSTGTAPTWATQLTAVRLYHNVLVICSITWRYSTLTYH